MARSFRFYEKKRGHRRTGSRTVGSAGEALFFAVLLVFGCAGIVAGIVFLVVPEWRVNHGFVETTCTVLWSRVAEEPSGSDGAVYRPEIKIRYSVGDTTYRPVTYDVDVARNHQQSYSNNKKAAATAADSFVKGQSYACWYDPANPGLAVLVRGYQWWVWLVFAVPVSFIAIGAGGLIYTIAHWGRSAERRAAMLRRAEQSGVVEPGHATAAGLPNVPDSSEISSSPGTKLAFRLPLSRSPAWTVFGLLVASLLWNGAVGFFAVAAVYGFIEVQPYWLFLLFSVPFLLVGIALIALSVWQLLLTTGIGPTLVEISAHPLAPGGQYRLLLSQSGRLKLAALEVVLVCEEEAIYRQGTNTRTETREVCRQLVLRREGFEIHYSEPFEAEGPLAVPGGAMHSFRARHNEIRWRVLVEGRPADRPPFVRTFPVILHPGAAASGDPHA